MWLPFAKKVEYLLPRARSGNSWHFGRGIGRKGRHFCEAEAWKAQTSTPQLLCVHEWSTPEPILAEEQKQSQDAETRTTPRKTF